MKDLTSLSVKQIESWNLSVSQLKGYLELEKRRHQELLSQLQQAELELSKIQGANIKAQQKLQNQISEILKKAEQGHSVAKSISQLRAQNIALQARIRATKHKIKEAQEQLKETEETFRISGGSLKQEKYSRVMSNISHAADLRETWDSDDVLAIDDYVMENGVTYDEAKEAIDRRKRTMDFSQELSDEE